MIIALFEPEIPQNTGTILRMADCLNIDVHIIEPCGFNLSNKYLKRSAMDYMNSVSLRQHTTYNDFANYLKKNNKRLVLATTKASNNHYDFNFTADDVILFGRESSGLPQYIHDSTPHKVKVKMAENKRSLNLAISTAIITSEAIRQVKV